jgi:tyrosyl-tRNA synthetase
LWALNALQDRYRMQDRNITQDRHIIMDMDAYTLTVRNTEEIVTDEDLKNLLKKSQKKVYCGYEPSGEIHLGHLTTINKLIDLKNAGFEIIVLLADLHAFLNRKGTLKEVR